MGNEVAKELTPEFADICILVVDDEESIRKTLEGVFVDEGFTCVTASDGASALEVIARDKPSLVMLDIWMPGMDGIETLKRMKHIAPDVPVIMISGHATIATAIQATRLGASNFIEKPLDLVNTIDSVKLALGLESSLSREGDELAEKGRSGEELTIGDPVEHADIRPIVFRSGQKLRGALVPQKTLAASTLLYGQGLHSGAKSGLILEPLPANSGIHFVGVSEPSPVPAHVDYVESTGLATTLKLGLTQVGTIEHLMSALRAYGICNLLIKCNGEVPVMDGSSLEFCTLLEEAGFQEQEGDWFEIAVTKTVRVGDGDEFIQIEPADGFVIDYTLDYPEPVGVQHLVFELGSDVEFYKKEIAPARTFGFVKDIGALHKMGLAQGGRFDNFVLYGDDGVINDELRFADEAVRHKILDAIGDLFLLGRPLRGKVTARMTGHSDNIALLQAIRKLMEE